MHLSPFMKGALGFLGCAAICGSAYAIGKSVGREEAYREIEKEEKRQEEKPVVILQEVKHEPEDISEKPKETEVPIQCPQPAQTSIVERVRQKHEKRRGFLSGISTVKDILGGNLDGKQLTVTTDGGDIIARISQKEGG